MSINLKIHKILKCKILVIFILLLNINTVNATLQDNKKDSLLLLINSFLIDTGQVNLHLKLAESTINKDINSRLYHIEYALSLRLQQVFCLSS